ncbi:MAG: NAD(P)H-dependent oxidoreductase [Xanthomonadales bacterium]|nr:NAD(P)H-dependent oxidoreductase [Xanthomonadales bacterium]
MNLHYPSLHRILALPGSLRRDSCNRKLLETASRCAPPDSRIELFDGLAEVPLFNEDLESVQPLHEGVRRLRKAAAGADGLLIATPEYNQSMPGVLKNAIDWLSRPLPDELLPGKPTAIMGASTGRWGTRLAQAALRQTLAATEALVMPAPTLFVRDAAQVFDDAGELGDPATRESLHELLLAFSLWIERAGTTASPIAARGTSNSHASSSLARPASDQ